MTIIRNDYIFYLNFLSFYYSKHFYCYRLILHCVGFHKDNFLSMCHILGSYTHRDTRDRFSISFSNTSLQVTSSSFRRKCLFPEKENPIECNRH